MNESNLSLHFPRWIFIKIKKFYIEIKNLKSNNNQKTQEK